METSTIKPSDLDNALRLFERLATGQHSETDVDFLRVAAIASGQEGQFQFGKFVVNVGSGKNIHIGDKIVVGSDAGIIRATIESIYADLSRNVFQFSLREYFRAIRMYAREFPYLSLNGPLDRSLSDVYVPLDVVTDSTDTHSKQSQRRVQDIRTALADAITGKFNGALVVGAPGAGKSTILRQILNHAWDSPHEIGLSEPHLAILVRFQFLVKSTGASLEERLWGACRESNEYMLSSPPPTNWFLEWPKLTGKQWLLLLDGLDEVPPDKEIDVEAWLRRVRESGYMSILTSRNTPAIVSSKFLRTHFKWYQVRPLTGAQQLSLARKWLDDESDHFFEQLERLRTADLVETPLLLTIAAIVFSSDRSLPTRRSALYRRFVNVWLTEAMRRGLAEDLGEVSAYIKDAFCHIALSMSVQAGSRTESAVRTELAHFFRS